MKIKLTITSLLLALATPVLAQTNAPVASSPIFEFLSTGTNWYAGTYGIYGIATSLNNYNSGNNVDAVGIFGSGVMLRIPSTKWYVPSDVIADYERWTGGPFKDNQFRLGLSWKI